MINFFIYAKDYSGSTNGIKYYHENSLTTLEQFNNDVEKIKNEMLVAGEAPIESRIVYLHWCQCCYEVDKDKAREKYIIFREGDHTARDPTKIIAWLQDEEENRTFGKNYTIKLLYMITNGLINEKLIQKSFKMNDKIHYEKVVFHAFNENLNEINLSVAASFFKSCCMVYRNNELCDSTDISKVFDYDKINLSNFAAEKKQLNSYIKLKFMRQFKQDVAALQEIDKLKKLRNRLLGELSSKNSNSEKSKVNLETKVRNIFLREFVRTDWYNNLNAPAEKLDIDKSISILISYIISDEKCYSFDALKFDTNFDKRFIEEEIVGVETEQKIGLPDVTLNDDKEIPVLILEEYNLMDQIIFDTNTRWWEPVSIASYNTFKLIMECPLFLLNNKEIIDTVGNCYTLNVYKELLVNQSKTDLQTPKPFYGGIVLTESDLFDKYNDYILSAAYFNCKKVNYNIGLFYFILWKNCENKNWMDKNVVEQFKKYAMRRISGTRCMIGLSSSPMDPQEDTSLLTALWYCLELSSCIFKNDPKNFMQERLRLYYGVAHHMIEILKYFDCDLNLDAIENRIELIRQVMVLKQIRKPRDKVYYLLEGIFKTSDGFLVSEIDKPFNLYTLNYLKLNHNEMLRDDIVEEKVYLNDYVHLMYFEDAMDASRASEGATFEICEKTFRPFFAIDQNKSFYEELMKCTRKVLINNDDDPDRIKVTYEAIDSLEFDRMLSHCKLFIDCVTDTMKYPTLHEYVKYVHKKIKFNWDLVTIFPESVYSDLKDVYERYQKIVTKVPVRKFIEVCRTYENRYNRIKAEGRVSFASDIEINNFISSEESKANVRY